jgi:hypothetical protein
MAAAVRGCVRYCGRILPVFMEALAAQEGGVTRRESSAILATAPTRAAGPG